MFLQKRSTVKECYERIIEDLKSAVDLLPERPQIKTRPSKGAALGALARVYLSMGKYEDARNCADKALGINNVLIDYNTINASAPDPFVAFNDEVIFHIVSGYSSSLQTWTCNIDSNLYQLYDANDLRKVVLYSDKGNKKYAFKGGYNGYFYGLTLVFGGIATDELYLTRAECNSRLGNLEQANVDLNTLLQKRWKNGTYISFNSSDQNTVLKKVLLERRKELVFRGTRWMDMRRFLNEPDKTVTPKRIINNRVYELLPNSDRYTLALPAVVITKTGMEQNP